MCVYEKGRKRGRQNKVQNKAEGLVLSGFKIHYKNTSGRIVELVLDKEHGWEQRNKLTCIQSIKHYWQKANALMIKNISPKLC